MEIYNEVVNDLLSDPKSRPLGGLKVKAGEGGVVFVDGIEAQVGRNIRGGERGQRCARLAQRQCHGHKGRLARPRQLQRNFADSAVRSCESSAERASHLRNRVRFGAGRPRALRAPQEYANMAALWRIRRG